MSKEDTNLILQAFLEIHPPKAHSMEITGVAFYVATDSLSNELMTDEELVQEIEAQRNLMIAVATGGPRIDDANGEYKPRRERIHAVLQSRGLGDPNPYSDLWAWYGKWSSGDLPTYQSRRRYISDLYEPLLERIRRGPTSRGAQVFEEPTGWARVDRGLGEVRERLQEAATPEQYQAVGLLCREVLISLAQTVYDPTRYPTDDSVAPSETDAKRMLDAYLLNELAGSANEVARRHARASLDLANELQHRRTATFREAALCSEATTSVVNLIAIISGQRNP
ncbi:MAG: hypothetical protein Q8O40_03435 [Chloroflexota bacterium]|nr:hypothetical protein [Chloroflexota bacterium]